MRGQEQKSFQFGNFEASTIAYFLGTTPCSIVALKHVVQSPEKDTCRGMIHRCSGDAIALQPSPHLLLFAMPSKLVAISRFADHDLVAYCIRKELA